LSQPYSLTKGGGEKIIEEEEVQLLRELPFIVGGLIINRGGRRCVSKPYPFESWNEMGKRILKDSIRKTARSTRGVGKLVLKNAYKPHWTHLS